MINRATPETFQKLVWEYYAAHGRHDLPWRCPEVDGSFDPYKILVSELMLQQTQVTRVMPKYHQFLAEFPTVESLAAAQLGAVLRLWSGLGYNRRAKFLWQAAQQLTTRYNGQFPQTVAELSQLPGIGPNTAGAILAYAFNQPTLFIETNIRTVYIHHFFADHAAVSDKQLLKLLPQTIDSQRPRQWYWALMDYGTFLKQTADNAAQRSKSYAKQSKFQGSKRQIRGQVLHLLANQAYSKSALKTQLSDERTETILQELLAEGLIQQTGHRLSL